MGKARSLLLIAPLLLLAAADGEAQTPAGVDLVVSNGAVTLGAACTVFDQVPYFPWVTPGEKWIIQAFAKPLSPHIVLFGPPPTSSHSLPGVDNLLLIHDPVVVLAVGMTGPLDPLSTCGQGHSDYPVKIPVGPSPGADFAMQLVGISSITGNWTFSKYHWITYL